MESFLTTKQSQLIEEDGLLMLNRSPINIHDLNTSNISDGIILYAKININPFLSGEVYYGLIAQTFRFILVFM